MTSRALIPPRRRGGLSESSSLMVLTVQLSRSQVMGGGLSSEGPPLPGLLLPLRAKPLSSLPLTGPKP